MKGVWLVGAVVGAIVGAAAWAGISAVTGYEVGLIAWAIGGLVGLGAKALGGRGTTTALVCAGLTLASIFAGKVTAVRLAVATELHEALTEEYSREYYDELMTDARDFAELSSEDDYPDFMASHGYSESESADGVDAEELDYFKATWVPTLEELHAQQPDFEEWRDREIAQGTEAIMSEFSLVEAVVEDLTFIDAIFALLGIATAYKLVVGREEE